MIVLLPFLAVWGLLALAGSRERRREARVFRQIALTDAIHREMGAVAAPEVHRTWSGEWVVSVRVALSREATVGSIARIPPLAVCGAHDRSPTGCRRVLQALRRRCRHADER